MKRALNYKMLLTCEASYPHVCRFPTCRQQFLDDIRYKSSNHSNIILRLQSTSVFNQLIQFNLKFINFTFASNLQKRKRRQKNFEVCFVFKVPTDFQATNLTDPANEMLTHTQLIQKCIDQNTNKQPIIIDTDADIDDLWAILYLINVINFIFK